MVGFVVQKISCGEYLDDLNLIGELKAASLGWLAGQKAATRRNDDHDGFGTSTSRIFLQKRHL